jgi:3-phenylpropionate/trans-cinnamate dioxygenase alpha subunit
MCTYHGWTYDLAGGLIGVPGMEELYKNELDKSEHGLKQVAQLDSYRGFVFCTMDPTAPPLHDYLGTTSRLAIDLLALRGDLEIVPGIQKFVIPCNWKFAVDNLFDWYHPQITHMSANSLLGITQPEDGTFVDGGGAMTPDGTDIDAAAGQKTSALDSIVVLGEYGHAIGGPNRVGIERLLAGPMSAVFSQAFRDTPEAREILGEAGSRVAGHPNIFPNTWITNLQISLRVPVGPRETQIWWYTFVPREMPDEHKAMIIAMANHVFGPAGFLEQEDGENWAQSTLQASGYHSRQVPHVLKMNLGNGKVERDRGLSYIEGHTTEHAQLWTYHAWQQWMSGCDWDELRARTQVPDVI